MFVDEGERKEEKKREPGFCPGLSTIRQQRQPRRHNDNRDVAFAHLKLVEGVIALNHKRHPGGAVVLLPKVDELFADIDTVLGRGMKCASYSVARYMSEYMSVNQKEPKCFSPSNLGG